MQLVNVSDYGIKGINYYWVKREKFNITVTELRQAGVTDGAAYVDVQLIEPLQKANEMFRKHGYELIVKDAYRSPALYKLVQQKGYALYGKTDTDRLLNVQTMPHSTGRTVDINLIDQKTGLELEMRTPNAGSDAFFIDYYKDKPDEQSRLYQERQVLLRETMMTAGFKLGQKKEFWHFEFPA